MRRAAGLFIIIAFMAAYAISPDYWGGPEGASATISFGFLLIAAYLFGDILSRANFPKITGYIIAGILAGPYAAGLITTGTVADLKLLDNLALAFIALSAGGELNLGELRRRSSSLCLGVLFQVIGVFAGIFCLIFLGRGFIPFLDGASMPVVLAAAALIGVLSIARSPSSAIAVISESKAKGPFTETALGVIVIIDVLVIALFAVAISTALAITRPDADPDVVFLITVGMELIGSIGAGIVLGWAIGVYLSRIGAEIPVLILAVAFLVSFFSEQFAGFLDSFYEIRFHLEPMLICITCGFYIRNFTKKGEFFTNQLDRLSLPVYVLFFSLIGASLDLSVLRQTWILAVLLAIGRGFFIWASAWLSGSINRDPPVFAKMAGFTYIAQAGVSIGLCSILANNFPDWGEAAAPTMVAMIFINQMIGPVTFKYALEKVGEAGAKQWGRP